MKNVIITGTSRGIGLELARSFAVAGHRVLALSRDQKPVKDLKEKAISHFPFDITNERHVQKVGKYVRNHWDEHVDILINNAGQITLAPFEKTTLRDFEDIFKVNFMGPVALVKYVLPYMKDKGHVVNITSMGGVQGSVKFPGLSAYSSSKGALNILTELLAEEYKNTGPIFNALALGAAQTEMFEEAFPGKKAPVTAQQMADYIMEFALTGHKYYNGKVLDVARSTP